jgi:hypothetical protein
MFILVAYLCMQQVQMHDVNIKIGLDPCMTHVTPRLV